MNSEKKLAIALTGYLTLVCFIIAVIPMQPPGRKVFVGVAIGSLFGFTILAATWTAFGPGQRLVRWTLGFLMLIAPTLSLFVSNPRTLKPVVVCQFVIVVLLLPLAALLRYQFGISLAKLDEPETMPPKMVVRQYGIKHLMILTALIAVLLSVGRVIVPFFRNFQATELPVWVFLAFSSCVMVVPILFSLLTLRNSFWPTLAIFGFSVLATWNESTLLSSLKLSGPDFFHFVWINLFTVLPVLLVAVGLRKCGYRLIGTSKVAAPNVTFDNR